MNTITIQPNLFAIKAWHGFMGVIGTLLVTIHLIGFSNGDLPDMWFLYFPAGLYLMIQEFGTSFGYFDIRYPAIKVSRHEVEANGIHWPMSIDFSKVKSLNLSHDKIQATYRLTGSTEKIRIPYSLRGKGKFETLKNALEARCIEAGVEFSVT